MFKQLLPVVILFPFILFAQTNTTHKTTPASGAQNPAPTSTDAKPVEDTNALTKDYRNSATIALSSIEDWVKTARGLTHFYSSGSVYTSRTALNREADARKKAEQDVKLAKIDVGTPGDKEFQKRLNKYLKAATTVNEAFISLSTGSLPKDAIPTMTGCAVILEGALDDASTERFSKFPDDCKPDQE